MTVLLEQWHIALAALRGNWFRALLTGLGVVIGVASLVAVTAVSAGAQADVSNSIRRLGANVVVVDGEFVSVGTTQSATDRTITPADVAGIAALPMIAAVAPHQDIESTVVSAGRYKTNTWLATGSSQARRQSERRSASGTRSSRSWASRSGRES
jgi:ABC-type lipoprotein release transport system permease subunit